MNNLYEAVDAWQMPRNLLTDSIADMAADGRRGCEGIVLWLGTIRDQVARVTHMVGPIGPLIEKYPDYLRIHSDLFNEIAAFSEKIDAVLVGQIHSHPGTFVNLSPTDIKYGVTAPYYLSVVAPHYAQDPSAGWLDCGVHICEPIGSFRRMTIQEVGERVRVVSDLDVPLVHLGGGR